MRRTTFLGLLLGGLLLAACQPSSGQPSSSGGDGGGGGGGPIDVPPMVTISVLDPLGSAGPFAIDQLDRFLINVDCSNLRPGTHDVRVAVMSPSGSLYAQLPSTLQADGRRRGRFSSTLQVRGSTIEGYRQVGSWQLVAYVDGVPLAAASVQITN